MRVLHLISSGGMYGAEAVILTLLGQMNGGVSGSSSLGVFSHDPEQVPELYDAALKGAFQAELVECRGQVDFAAAKKIRDLAKATGSDIVHAHGYKADIYSFLAFRGRERPSLVSTCHTWYDNDLAVRMYGAVDRWVLRHFDQVVAVSPSVRDRLLHAGVLGQKIQCIRNGIDYDRFAQAASGRCYDRSSSALRVGLVGRLAPEKGVDVFLRSIALLAGEGAAAEFTVAGDGPDRAALEYLLRELGMEDRVRLIGSQSDMAAHYASLDILVSASRHEGLPMAMLEGMASGLPVLATKVGAVPQVVVDGQTGILVPPGSPEALAEGLAWMLRDAPLRERFGRAGQDRVRNEFSAERMAREYLSVYRRALSGRKPLSVGQSARA
jgi:glycosyltransferase involved in cell wall biosynthesis